MSTNKNQALMFDILLNFSDTNVDVVGMCQENQFLVVGERSGNFHLIHIPSKQTLLTKVQPLFYSNFAEDILFSEFLELFFRSSKYQNINVVF